MDPLKDRLLALGQKVARASDDSAQANRTIAEVRDRLRNATSSKAAGARVPTMVLAGLLAVVLCTGGYAFWSSRHSEALTFTVESQAGRKQRALETGAAETKQLRFSDGTTLSLQPSSRVEVHALTANGATVGLLEGRARASVQRSPDAHWQFLAGPFFVQVTGTEFDLAWDPKARVFELALHEGSVEVSGPSLKSTRRVGQGEFVRIALSAEGSDAPVDESDQRPNEPAALEAPAGAEAPAQPEETLPEETQAEETIEASWPELLRSGQRQAAFATVERLGPAAFARASKQELWDLAHAARLGGRPRLAEQALLTLRQKHGASGQTAFLLGKVAADQLNRAPEAITWFQTYLAEAPQGPLAEQALGRLVELQAGTRVGKRAANEYLTRYPEGAYASFARSLLR